MSESGEFGFSRRVMHTTGANGPFELVGMDRTRVRDGLLCDLSHLPGDRGRLRTSNDTVELSVADTRALTQLPVR
jgi:hypothetical protein